MVIKVEAYGGNLIVPVELFSKYYDNMNVCEYKGNKIAMKLIESLKLGKIENKKVNRDYLYIRYYTKSDKRSKITKLSGADGYIITVYYDNYWCREVIQMKNIKIIIILNRDYNKKVIIKGYNLKDVKGKFYSLIYTKGGTFNIIYFNSIVKVYYTNKLIRSFIVRWMKWE